MIRLPEVGPGSRPRLHLAGGESAGVRFRWVGDTQHGALVVAGYVDATAERRARNAGAAPGVTLASCNGVVLAGCSREAVLQRVAATADVPRQLGFLPYAACVLYLAPLTGDVGGSWGLCPQLDATRGNVWLTEERSRCEERASNQQDPYSTAARRRRITHGVATRFVTQAVRGEVLRVMHHRLEGLAAVAVQRQQRGAAVRRTAAALLAVRHHVAGVLIQVAPYAHRSWHEAQRAAIAVVQQVARCLLAAHEMAQCRCARAAAMATMAITAQSAVRRRCARRRATWIRRTLLGGQAVLEIILSQRADMFNHWRAEAVRSTALSLTISAWWHALCETQARRSLMQRCATLPRLVWQHTRKRSCAAAWATWCTKFESLQRGKRLAAVLTMTGTTPLVVHLTDIATEDSAAEADNVGVLVNNVIVSAISSFADTAELAVCLCTCCGFCKASLLFPTSDANCLECFDASNRLTGARLTALRQIGVATSLQARLRGANMSAHVRAQRSAARRMAAATAIAAAGRGTATRRVAASINRAALVVACAMRGALARRQCAILRDAWGKGIMQLYKDSVDELADWPSDAERLPNGDWPTPYENFVDPASTNPWDHILLLTLRKPLNARPPAEADWAGARPAAMITLKLLIEQTPPPPNCLDVRRCLRILTDHLPKHALDLRPPPSPPAEFDFAPGDEHRDESDDAEAQRRRPLSPPLHSDVEIFLERWYTDHPECPRIDLGPDSIWEAGLPGPCGRQ
mmetsp:Transcript_25306/g.75982  ORF Transcript_25306/g.75982 Transcript_25306/m.75982 type:complete len:748 (-) Transcript_25306:10-2253(-)